MRMPEPLSQLELDILELEMASFGHPGNKLNEFKARHPHVTLTGYTVTLYRLLADPRAYEQDDGRYAATLGRIGRLHEARWRARAAAHGVEPE
jgi:hypothetical protein